MHCPEHLSTPILISFRTRWTVLKKVKFSSPQLIIAWDFPWCTSTKPLHNLLSTGTLQILQIDAAPQRPLLFDSKPSCLKKVKKPTPSSRAVGGSRSLGGVRQTGFFGGTTGALVGRGQGIGAHSNFQTFVKHCRTGTNGGNLVFIGLLCIALHHRNLLFKATSNFAPPPSTVQHGVMPHHIHEETPYILLFCISPPLHRLCQKKIMLK